MNTDPKPPRSAPIIDIVDWYCVQVRDNHPGWSDDDILAEAEVRAGNYAR